MQFKSNLGLITLDFSNNIYLCCYQQMKNLIIAAFTWATLSVTVKLLLQEGFDVLTVAAIRGVGTALVLMFFCTYRELRLTRWGIASACSYAMTSLTMVYGLKTINSGTAFFLQTCAPVYIPFLAYFINSERATNTDLRRLSIVILGVVLLLTGEQDLELAKNWGVVVSAISGICWALTIVFQKRMDLKESRLAMIIGNIIFLPALFPHFLNAQTTTAHQLTLILMVGIVGSAIPMAAFIYGSQKAPSSLSIGIALISEPVFAMLFAALFINELPSNLSIIGATIILSGIVYGLIQNLKPQQTPPAGLF